MNASCLLCGASAPFHAQAAKRPFHKCPECGLIFVPGDWHVTPEAERARYGLHRNTPGDRGYVAFLNTAIEALTRHVPAQGAPRVLDYGCGPDPVLVGLLNGRGFRAEGYDPFFAPDIRPGAVFDAVVSTEAIEHFRKPAAELDRMAGLTRTGGVMVIMTSLTDGIEDISRWHYALDSTHIALYSLTTFSWIASHWPLSVMETNGRNLVVLGRRPCGANGGA